MDKPFRFGVVGGNVSSRAEWISLARKAEELGYSTLLVPDRVVMPVAALTAMAVAVEVTTSLRVGSYVFCNDYRHPALLAKEVATLDLLSGGRVELGLGAGVGPVDYEQLGLPFDSAGTRVSRLEESLRIIKLLFSGENLNFSGKYYTITDMRGSPRPVQRPHPPILVAGGHKRMLSLAAQHADIVAIASSMAPGATSTEASLEQKVAWVREAAGERFDHLELAQTTFSITIADSAVEVASVAGGPPLPMLAMSTGQAITHLLEQREQYGFSYIQISQAQIENFAPIVARLTGK